MKDKCQSIRALIVIGLLNTYHSAQWPFNLFVSPQISLQSFEFHIKSWSNSVHLVCEVELLVGLVFALPYIAERLCL